MLRVSYRNLLLILWIVSIVSEWLQSINWYSYLIMIFSMYPFMCKGGEYEIYYSCEKCCFITRMKFSYWNSEDAIIERFKYYGISNNLKELQKYITGSQNNFTQSWIKCANAVVIKPCQTVFYIAIKKRQQITKISLFLSPMKYSQWLQSILIQSILDNEWWWIPDLKKS